MPSFQIHCETHAAVLAQTCAEHVAEILRHALQVRGRASMAVSGGASPVALFAALSHCPLDWSRVTLTLVDERWVPLQHPDSNEGLIRRHLLQSRAAAADWLGWVDPDWPHANTAQALLRQRLQALPDTLDIVLCGVGEDGHSASWFPGAPSLVQCLNGHERCYAVDPIGTGGVLAHERMTLSATYVLSAQTVIVYAPGARKLQVLAQVLQDPNPLRYPVAQLFHHSRLHWWTSSQP